MQILWIMALLVLYGNNANFVAESLTSLRITVAAYIVIRFSQACYFAYYSIASPHHRLQNRCYVVSETIVILIWVPLFFEEVTDRAKIAVAFVAIIVEVCDSFNSAIFACVLRRCSNLGIFSLLDPGFRAGST